MPFDGNPVGDAAFGTVAQGSQGVHLQSGGRGKERFLFGASGPD